MGEPESFYVGEGARFRATELTRGPWQPEHQHGGPPAGLLARAIERCAAGKTLQLARMTVELIRPVPIDLLSVSAEVIRAGRTVTLVQATLRSGDKELCRATGLLIRTAAVALPTVWGQATDLPLPGESVPFVFPFFLGQRGYHTAMECRVARGRFGEAHMALWMRMRVPLVAGEVPSPLQRAVVAADSGNGVSVALDPRRYTFINPDLTVHLHRLPEGEWVCLDATTTPWANGVGLAESALHDVHGPIGRSLQSLIVEGRQP